MFRSGRPTAMWWKRMPKRVFWTLVVVAAVAIALFVLWVGPWLFTRHPSRGLTAEQALAARNDVRGTLVQAEIGRAHV